MLDSFFLFFERKNKLDHGYSCNQKVITVNMKIARITPKPTTQTFL